MIKINRTYAIITEESAEQGDFAETGMEAEGEMLTFRELVDAIREHYGEASSSGPVDSRTWFTACEPNIIEGGCTDRSIHFADTDRKAKYWVKAARLAVSR
jgi:hypothetical protein